MTAHASLLPVWMGDVKEQSPQTLTAMRLSMSDAMRLFLRLVVIDQAFPLELKGSRAGASCHG